MHTLIDTHCHLDAEPMGNQVEAVIARAAQAGVGAFIAPGVSEETSQRVVELASVYRGTVFAAIGVHPQTQVATIDMELLSRLAREPGVVAVGEIGLDAEVERPDLCLQERHFMTQMAFACDVHLPVLIHCRGAFGKLIEIAKKFGDRGPRGILHAWAGSEDAARELFQMGFYCGVAGVVTRPRATRRRKVIAALPLERLVLETDSPYIATERSPVNAVEPADLVDVCRAVAEIKGVSPEEVARMTTENARRLLGISD